MVSIVLRALDRPGAWDVARCALIFFYPTHTKALSLMEKDVVDLHCPLPEEIQLYFVASLKQNEKIVQYMERVTSWTHMGIRATGMWPDPMDFTIIEQTRASKELETTMFS